MSDPDDLLPMFGEKLLSDDQLDALLPDDPLHEPWPAPGDFSPDLLPLDRDDDLPTAA